MALRREWENIIAGGRHSLAGEPFVENWSAAGGGSSALVAGTPKIFRSTDSAPPGPDLGLPPASPDQQSMPLPGCDTARPSAAFRRKCAGLIDRSTPAWDEVLQRQGDGLQHWRLGTGTRAARCHRLRWWGETETAVSSAASPHRLRFSARSKASGLAHQSTQVPAEDVHLARARSARPQPRTARGWSDTVVRVGNGDSAAVTFLDRPASGWLGQPGRPGSPAAARVAGGQSSSGFVRWKSCGHPTGFRQRVCSRRQAASRPGRPAESTMRAPKSSCSWAGAFTSPPRLAAPPPGEGLRRNCQPNSPVRIQGEPPGAGGDIETGRRQPGWAVASADSARPAKGWAASAQAGRREAGEAARASYQTLTQRGNRLEYAASSAHGHQGRTGQRRRPSVGGWTGTSVTRQATGLGTGLHMKALTGSTSCS